MRAKSSPFWSAQNRTLEIAHAGRTKSCINEPQICRASGIVNVTFGVRRYHRSTGQPLRMHVGRRMFSSAPSLRSNPRSRSGNAARIQSHAFICELVTIGDDCFISHGAMFINDAFVETAVRPGNAGALAFDRIGNDRQYRDQRYHHAGHDLRSTPPSARPRS